MDTGSYKVCLGSRQNPSSVRAIIISGRVYYPPSYKDPKWLPYNSYYIRIVSPSTNSPDILIPIDRTQNTSSECWAILPDSVHLKMEEFFDLILRLRNIKTVARLS
jgi:hypothetical protein